MFRRGRNCARTNRRSLRARRVDKKTGPRRLPKTSSRILPSGPLADRSLDRSGASVVWVPARKLVGFFYSLRKKKMKEKRPQRRASETSKYYRTAVRARGYTLHDWPKTSFSVFRTVRAWVRVERKTTSHADEKFNTGLRNFDVTRFSV